MNSTRWRWRWAIMTSAVLTFGLPAMGQEMAPGDAPAVDEPVAIENDAPAEIMDGDPTPAPLEWQPDAGWRPVEPLTGWRARLAGKLEIGLRGDRFSLRTRRHERIENGEPVGFIGSINELEERQNLSPTKPVLAWMIREWIGVEFTWSALTARTRSFTPDPTDGDFTLEGPLFQVMLRYRNATRFTPYGGMGWVFYKARVDHADWWHYGYPSYDYWQAVGEPKASAAGYIRQFDPDDTRGMVLTAGCLAALADHFSLDLFLRNVRADLDVQYTRWDRGQLIEDQGIFKLPFDHIAFGLGVRYQF